MLEIPAPDLDPASPWWAWPLSIAAWVVVTWLLNRKTRKDVGAIKEQVQNTHSTNFRDDLDALTTLVREGLQGVRDDVGGLHSETRDLRKDVAGIRDDARHDRRQLAAQRRDLDEHLREVPDLTAKTVAEHIAACPLRQADEV